MSYIESYLGGKVDLQISDHLPDTCNFMDGTIVHNQNQIRGWVWIHELKKSSKEVLEATTCDRSFKYL